MTLPALYFARKGMKIPISLVRVHACEIGASWTVEIDLVCTVAAAQTFVATDQEDWLYLSDDAGSTYDPVPDDIQGGLQYGAMAAGERTGLILKVLVPVGTDVRRRFLSLDVSPGEGSTPPTYYDWDTLTKGWASLSGNWETEITI